jgi:hypothetical protein
MKQLDDEKHGRGPGPSQLDCLLYAGHTGVSTDQDATIYGFNPDIGTLPLWQAMEQLRNGDAFKGIVSNDTQVFVAAAGSGLTVLVFDIILPDPTFQIFQDKLSDEQAVSHYSYGFPNGNGDCNCTTWLERMALPLLTGRMDEFVGLLGFNIYPRRRFGSCV